MAVTASLRHGVADSATDATGEPAKRQAAEIERPLRQTGEEHRKALEAADR